MKEKIAGVGTDHRSRRVDLRHARPTATRSRARPSKAVGIAQENPLGLAVGAVAVGFLAGMLIPESRMEHEKLGPMADEVKQQVRDTGQEALEHGKQVAQDAMEGARDDRAGVRGRACRRAQGLGGRERPLYEGVGRQLPATAPGPAALPSTTSRAARARAARLDEAAPPAPRRRGPAAHAASSRARARSARLAQRPADRQAHRSAGAAKPARQPHADAGPVDPRGVLVHVAARRAGTRRRSRLPAPARPCRARRGRPPRRSAASSASTTPTRTSRALSGLRRPARAAARFYVASTRTGSRASPSTAARSSRCDGSCDGRRRDEHERVVARRRLDVAERLLPQQRADDVRAAGQAPRVLELRERRDQRQPRDDPAVHPVERRQPEPRGASR